MKKDEFLRLHMLLARLKRYCEETGMDCDFKDYNELEIFPFQVHRSKEEHKQAIFTLATTLAAGA